MITSNFTIFGRKYGNNLLDKLVAYYKFDSNALSSTGANNGFLIGSPTFVAGKIGNCVDFGNNASINAVEMNDSNDLSFTTGGGNDVPFSISMWVNFTGLSGTGNWLINKRNATSGGDEYQLVYTGNTFFFSKIDRNSNAIYQGIQSAVIPVTLGSWYHLALTDNGSKTNAGMKMYLNGVLLTTTNLVAGVYTGMPNGTSICRLGINSWAPSSALKHRGKMDEVAIYKDRALTQAEVTQLYNAGAGITYPF